MSKLTLSGYKTNIGLILVGIGGIVELFGFTMPPVLKDVGLMLVGVGATHRVLKDTGTLSG
jgi:hypothetical protein